MSLSRHAWVTSMIVAACATPVQWEKPGATAAQVQEDSQQCRVELSLSPMSQHYAPVPAGRATVGTNVLSRSDQRAKHEAEEFQKCMTDKGYSAKR